MVKAVIRIPPLGRSSDDGISFKDGPMVDSFGRGRFSQPYGVWDDKTLYSANSNHYETVLGGGGTSTFLTNESSTQLAVTAASGDSVIRQTTHYIAYVPGKSHFVTVTGVLGAAQANTVKRIGYFDDKNGLFFEEDGSNKKVVIRSDTSGSPVDIAINQSDWNVDKFDGTGPSGITIDFSKRNIFVIDFQWLGVGRVRYGFDIDGKLYYCHQINHANNGNKVYMRTPTLPIRYEIRNTGVAAGASSMKAICNSVASEGGYALPGLEYSAGLDIATRAVSTTQIPIFAVRLVNSFNGFENRRTLRVLRLSAFADTQNIIAKIAHVHAPSAITASWTPLGAGSAAEYSTNITAVTGNPAHFSSPTYVAAGQGNLANTSNIDQRFVSRHSIINQNYPSNNSQMFVVYAQAFTGTANVSASLDWLEYE